MSVDKQGYHSGTTAVVGILRDNNFIVANAGDSKCVLGSRGKYFDQIMYVCPVCTLLNRYGC